MALMPKNAADLSVLLPGLTGTESASSSQRHTYRLTLTP
jgi:hypothetical protein